MAFTIKPTPMFGKIYWAAYDKDGNKVAKATPVGPATAWLRVAPRSGSFQQALVAEPVPSAAMSVGRS
jgi:hypothetical protein